MEQMDPIRAQRVWQRVSGNEAAADPLPRLIALEQEAGLVYGKMAQCPNFSTTRLLARLREENRSFLQVYAGLLSLTSGDTPDPCPRHSLRGTPEGFAQHCWELRRQSLALLNSAQLPSACMGVLDTMKRRTTDHCALLAQLIGLMKLQQA